MQKYPIISILTPIKNVERTLSNFLNSLLVQEYPRNKLEIIIIDGGSTDRTLEILKKTKLNVKVVQGKFPNDPEACKGQVFKSAKGEIIALLDADNYIPHKKWISEMVEPLLKNKEIVGSYPWRFAYRKQDNLLNRYFSLIGSCDPVGLYLGKADKMSYVSNKWSIAGDVVDESKKYFTVQFNKENFPTLGSNGFFGWKKYLSKGKTDIRHFFHIDVPYDILKFNLNTYAVVKDVIIHDTAAGSVINFVIKRTRYMMLHYQKRGVERRYFVFDPERKQDVWRLMLFIIFSITFIEPFLRSIFGYIKIRDRAWFVHPFLCFGLCIGYMYAILVKYIKN